MEKLNSDTTQTNPPNPYDAGWKRILYKYLYLAIELAFPSFYQTIDTTVPPKFLNTELQKLDPQSKIGNLYPDLLVQIRTKQGRKQLLLCHIEVQTKAVNTIPKRMFDYGMRIRQHFNQVPIGILILADPSKKSRPTKFEYREPNTGLTTRYEFLLFKTADWKHKRQELRELDNVIAQVIYVYLEFQDEQKMLSKKRKQGALRLDLDQLKLEFKKRLFAHLITRDMDAKEIGDVQSYLDWIVILPKLLDEYYYTYQQEITADKEGAMAWVSTPERIGIRRGKEIGKEIGTEIGKEIGKLELARELVIRLLEKKFGLTQDDVKIIMSVENRELLEKAHDEILFAQNKKEIFDLFQSPN